MKRQQNTESGNKNHTDIGTNRIISFSECKKDEKRSEHTHMNEKISLVVPCYNEEATISFLYEEIKNVFSAMQEDYELIFIDDGSSDGTLDILRGYASEDECVYYYSFSRNFGKEAAMYAGLCNSTGDYIAVLDADMQDPPSLIPEMLRILKTKEYDCVASRRENRKGESPVRSFFARMFYKLINKLSDVDVVDGARDFRLMTRQMVDAIISMGENNRFSKGIFAWVGFRTFWLSYENIERVAGKTKWSFRKLMRYGIDGIVDFSDVPLSIASWLGVVLSAVGFFAVLFIVIRKLVSGDPVAGWASTNSIIIFIGGVQLFCLGVIGKYLAKVFVETKNRPHYIIKESNR